MQAQSRLATTTAPLLAVRTAEDIEYLVKECEVLTGRPGRVFVIAGADRLSYRIQWHALGIKVERLDSRGESLHAEYLLLWELLDHPLVEAQHTGQLFTVPVSPLR